ncbi:2'-hydroxyisoflavone reductase [Marininema mesophilum]|uniref:2'-hydroxyisoflavone reductase n=1 Tax=Marininema mesophilum TaxID=1048340 RepID=A0A1H2VDD5_9BACL|nr:NAD-dependent epimerase/dehydratase family protein [Marininema mesophilum]SDW65934.1 2'-hydroxyisoflavone reductase [Marininema mesophilum]
MKLLIIGGTQFMGRHLTSAALARGWEVTLFNRGQTNPGLFPDVEEVHGDRTKGLSALQGRHWDVVIDPSGFLPQVIRDNVRTLARLTDHYTFISSVSAYASFAHPHITETSPLAPLPKDSPSDTLTGENYGALKVLCEQAAEQEMPSRVLTIRPGLIVGPYDPSNRFTYWCRRLSQGGEILAPGQPGLPVQYIDVRDLAEWILDMAQARHVGIYNAIGPAKRLTIGEFLEEGRQTLNPDATLFWADDQFLGAHQVQPWTEMPLYIPEGGPWIEQHGSMQGFLQISNAKALQSGLTFRPLSETLKDTWHWEKNRVLSLPKPARAYQSIAGMDADREGELLELLKKEKMAP